MYWADNLAKTIIESGKYSPFWVDDMKTPSGHAHVGSLLGPVLHSLVYRALKDAGSKSTFTFVINDFDAVDGLSKDLEEKFSKYMGFPLKNVPSPNPDFKNMADYFADDFIKSFRSLGVEAKTLSSWDMYHEGKFDEMIRLALDNSEKIQDIYQKISGSQKKQKGWLPFQVICPNCGKLGTTRVFEWDGKEVSYKCEPELVKWAKGCGHEGKISPFGGNGKLPWKVDWAAHWKVIGVTVEGAGKDHASAGGSYDIAMAISKEVFKYPQPFRLPYEFILIGGRKMSTSKGLGIKAHDLVQIMPSEVGRFLFARHNYKKQSNFDPVGTMAIPDLFDEYDKGWQLYNLGQESDLARTFELSQIDKLPDKNPNLFLPRFRVVANYLQQPSMDIVHQFETEKGSKLTSEESRILKERSKYAAIWNENYAPEEYRLEMTSSLPEEARNLNRDQKKFLSEAIHLIEEGKKPEDLQQELYDLSKTLKLQTKTAFASIYLAFLGRESGPKAGWFLSQYPKKKVVERLEAASGQK